jgi:nucleotide-binding universal stress UspA family protein
MKFRRILAATDFSPESRAAARAGATLAAKHRGILWIAHAVPTVIDSPGGLPRMYREMQALVEADSNRHLSAAVRAASKPGVAARALDLRGSAADAIRRAAVSKKADLVVVGTHGRTGLPRLLVGSVAAKILATSPCPVLAVSRRAFSGRVRRIVVGTDFSPASRRAWETALSLARNQRGRLRVVHAVRPLAQGQAVAWAYAEAEAALVAEARVRLRKLVAEARRAGVSADAVVLIGAAHEVLAGAARGQRDAWIVVGTHGRTGLRGALLGSVAARVVATAPCPVLTVRSGTSNRSRAG